MTNAHWAYNHEPPLVRPVAVSFAALARGTAGALRRHLEFRAAAVRPPHKDALWVREFVESSDWQVVADYAFDTEAHINVQEGRAIRTSANCVARRGGERRSVKLADSQVQLGCHGRGRSSASALNMVLRPTSATMVSSNSYSSGIHVGTKWNPADDPTRNAFVRKPVRDRPRWYLELEGGVYERFDEVVMSDNLVWPLSGWSRILGCLEEVTRPIRGPWAA